jgi:hypothetical protein
MNNRPLLARETWAPDACTLPTAERPLRVAEFDQLFANHVRSTDRVDAQTLDLTLDPEARATAEDLIARESECCSFFTFTLSGAVHLRITVPPAHTAVLDGLAERAR